MKTIYEPAPLRAMELKYCERCGQLWLRRCGSSRAHCNLCAHAEAMLVSHPSSFLQFWSSLRTEVQA